MKSIIVHCDALLCITGSVFKICNILSIIFLNECYKQNLLEYQTICPTLEIKFNIQRRNIEDPPFNSDSHVFWHVLVCSLIKSKRDDAVLNLYKDKFPWWRFLPVLTITNPKMHLLWSSLSINELLVWNTSRLIFSD